MRIRFFSQRLQGLAMIRRSDGRRVIVRKGIDDCKQVSRRSADDCGLRLPQQQKEACNRGSEQDTDKQSQQENTAPEAAKNASWIEVAHANRLTFIASSSEASFPR